MDRVQLCGGLGGGAEQSSSVARDLHVFRTAVSDPKSLSTLASGSVEPVVGARRATVQGAVGSTVHALSIAPAGAIN